MTDDGGNWGGGRGTQVRATKEIELPGLGDQSLACGISVAGMGSRGTAVPFMGSARRGQMLTFGG